ncbi:hypothetical protein D3C81_579190 [compost metagenome]
MNIVLPAMPSRATRCGRSSGEGGRFFPCFVMRRNDGAVILTVGFVLGKWGLKPENVGAQGSEKR